MNHTGSLSLGVAAGFVAAFFSAVSYLVSRHHGNRAGGGSLRLLVLGHVVMGVACLPLVWWLEPAAWPDQASWLGPLAGCVAGYLVGQAGVFAALKHVAASRLAPLLGLKLVMLAGIVSLGPGPGLDPRQWLAVGLTVVAAGLLQRGGPVPGGALGIVLAACLGFACSDLFILRLIDALGQAVDASGRPLARLHAGGLAMAVTYVVCGGLGAAALAVRPAWRPRNRRDGVAAGQYAAAWLLSVVGLYSCFGLVGVVLGSVLQATRGVMAVVLGAGLARAGWHDLEERVDRGTLLRRVVAALLMAAAIGLYVVDLS